MSEQILTEEDKLRSTLLIARRYAEWYEPRDYSEAHERDMLLKDIDLLTLGQT